MLSELWRRAAVLHRRRAHADAAADAGDLRAVAPRELDLQAAVARLLHLEHLLEIVDRSVRHAARIELRREIVDPAFRERLAQLAEREFPVDLAPGGRGEP